MTNAPTTRETADHAELAALVQDLRNSRTVWDNARARPKEIETRAADALENLLSEIAALRDYGRDVAKEALEYRRQRDELRKALEDHDQTAAECRIDGARPQRDTTAPCELCGATQRESCGRKGSAAYAFISSARTLLANQGSDQ